MACLSLVHGVFIAGSWRAYRWFMTCSSNSPKGGAPPPPVLVVGVRLQAFCVLSCFWRVLGTLVLHSPDVVFQNSGSERSQTETKAFQNHLSKLTGCLSKLTFGSIWLHFGSIWAPFGLHFGSFLASFWHPFFGHEKRGEKGGIMDPPG